MSLRKSNTVDTEIKILRAIGLAIVLGELSLVLEILPTHA